MERLEPGGLPAERHTDRPRLCRRHVGVHRPLSSGRCVCVYVCCSVCSPSSLSGTLSVSLAGSLPCHWHGASCVTLPDGYIERLVIETT